MVIGNIPLSPDEAYYWTWSRRLAVCYYDQPGMVAWVYWLFALPGAISTPFRARLAAVVISAVSTWIFYRAYREYRDDEEEALVFAVVFSVLPFTWIAGIILIHDTVLLPWIVLVYWVFIRLAKFDGRAGDWLLLSIALTGAMYAKFSAVMVVWGLFLYMLWSPKARKWWWTWPPYAAGVITTVLYLPVVWWNAQNDWISVHAVGELTKMDPLTILERLTYVAEYVVSQVGIFSPLLGIVVFGALIKGVREAVAEPGRDRVVLPVCLSLPVFVYFFGLSTRSHVYGNWPGIAYFPVCLLAMREVVRAWRAREDKGLFGRRLVAVALVLNLMLVVTALLHLQFRIFRPAMEDIEERFDLHKRIDWRLDMDFEGWDTMVVLARGARPGMDFIMARRYQVASMLEFMMPDQPYVECYNKGQRGNQWDLWSRLDERRGQSALYVDIKPIPRLVRERFEEVEPVVQPMILGDPERPIKRLFLYRCRGWKGP